MVGSFPSNADVRIRILDSTFQSLEEVLNVNRSMRVGHVNENKITTNGQGSQPHSNNQSEAVSRRRNKDDVKTLPNKQRPP